MIAYFSKGIDFPASLIFNPRTRLFVRSRKERNGEETISLEQLGDPRIRRGFILFVENDGQHETVRRFTPIILVQKDFGHFCRFVPLLFESGRTDERTNV